MLSSLPRGAWSEDTARATASAEFESAHRAFESADYESAQKHYTRAYQLLPHPSTLYNLALTFARDQYRRYTHLRQAFADFPELPDKPDLPDKSA